jgi:hypothetical protein
MTEGSRRGNVKPPPHLAQLPTVARRSSSETTVRHRTIDRFQEEPVEISDPCAPHTPRPIGLWRRQGDKVAEQAMTPSRTPLLASILLAPDVGRHATDVQRT